MSQSNFIQANITYIVDTGVRPVRYVDWPEMAHKEIEPQFREHAMVVRNGRPLRAGFSLDTHGFVFVDHASAARDFTDAAERAKVYEPEVKALVSKHLGAAEVVIFDHTVRISDVQGQGTPAARPTVKAAHNDYTETAALWRLRETVGEQEAELRGRRRWAMVQVWRPLQSTVLKEPLGICDGRSFAPEAFVVRERHYKDRRSEVYYPTYNAGHQWYYFPRMERNEALLFKVYDSDTSLATRFTIHSAFDDPATPADAPPRASIETRTFAFFD